MLYRILFCNTRKYEYYDRCFKIKKFRNKY